MEAEARSDVAQERAIFNIGHFISLHVSDIHSEPVNVKVRFADVDEGRDDEEVDKFLEMKAANPVAVRVGSVACAGEPPPKMRHATTRASSATAFMRLVTR